MSDNLGYPRKLHFLVTEDWYFVSHRLSLALAAKNSGYDVTVVTRVRDHGPTICAAGLRLIPFENSRTGMNPISEIWTIIRLIMLWRRERPNIVHNVAMKPVIYGSIAAHISGVPSIINALAGMGWLFASDSGLARWIKPAVRLGLRLLLRSGIVLVQNPDDARMLMQLGIQERNIRHIAGAGVDLQQYFPQPESSDIPIVVLPARLLWDKGVGDFVIAARYIKQQGIRARFVLAGNPDQANPSSISLDQITKWVTDGIVEHLGWVNNMPKLLAESHIVCLPSYREGLPKALVEAAAAGRAIVSTDVPGCREIVHHNDNGLLVPARNAEALAEALIRLIKDPVLRQQMGTRGRIRAEQEFGSEIVIAQTLALYAEAPV